MKNGHIAQFIITLLAITIGMTIIILSINYSIYTMEDKSMGETIEIGECVIVNNCEIGEIHKGEVVVYREEDGVKIRRVVSSIVDIKGTRFLYVKGDSYSTCEELAVAGDMIIGKAIMKTDINKRIREKINIIREKFN